MKNCKIILRGIERGQRKKNKMEKIISIDNIQTTNGKEFIAKGKVEHKIELHMNYSNVHMSVCNIKVHLMRFVCTLYTIYWV